MYKLELLNLKMPADIKGFEYLNQAIQVYEPGMQITKLYEQIVKCNNDTPSRVERAIRHAISKIDIGMTNGNFIASHKILWSKEGEQRIE